MVQHAKPLSTFAGGNVAVYLLQPKLFPIPCSNLDFFPKLRTFLPLFINIFCGPFFVTSTLSSAIAFHLACSCFLDHGKTQEKLDLPCLSLSLPLCLHSTVSSHRTVFCFASPSVRNLIQYKEAAYVGMKKAKDLSGQFIGV